MNILKQQRVTWLNNVLRKTPEERKISWWKGLMQKMRNLCPTTHTSYSHIGRNDPCVCGNVYAGVFLLDRHGNKKKGLDGKLLEKPVKFKHCCLHKFVGLRPGEVTPEMRMAQIKQKAYFKKTGKVVSV